MKTFLLLIITAFTVIGCSSTTEQVTTPSGPHILKQGDTFTYHEHQTDTLGLAISGTDTTITAIVSTIYPTFKDKSGVAEIIFGTDSVHIATLTDSSFDLLQEARDVTAGLRIPSLWINYSPALLYQKAYDSTTATSLSGTPAIVRILIEARYLGKNTTAIAGKAIQTYNYSKTTNVIVTVFGKDYTTVVTVMNSYAPSIGFLTSRVIKSTSDSQNSPVPNGIVYDDLTAYSFK